METNEERRCRVCTLAKPLDQFYKGQGNTCKDCIKKRNRAWRKNNPVRYRATRRAWERGNIDLARARRRNRLRRRYKLSKKKFNELFEKQGGKCAICQVEFYNPLEEEEREGTTKPVVDHSHRDGHVRGLLCSACNVALGLLEDSLSVIKSAYGYLKNDEASSALR